MKNELKEFVIKQIQLFKASNNALIKSHLTSLIIKGYNSLDKKDQDFIEQDVLKIIEQYLNNVDFTNISKDNSAINEYLKFVNENNVELEKWISLQEFNDLTQEERNVIFWELLRYIDIHTKNMNIIKNLLKSCKKNLNKLSSKINKFISKKDKNPEDIYFCELEEITSISIQLRYCLEIVIWSSIKYNDEFLKDETINQKLNKTCRIGKLFEIYKNNPKLDIEVRSLNSEEFNHFILKDLEVECSEFWKKDNIKKVYSDLSSIVHYDFVEHSMEEILTVENKINIFLNMNSKKTIDLLSNKIYMMKDKYDRLNNIYKKIYETLKDHVIYINNLILKQIKFSIFVKDFNVKFTPNIVTKNTK